MSARAFTLVTTVLVLLAAPLLAMGGPTPTRAAGATRLIVFLNGIGSHSEMSSFEPLKQTLRAAGYDEPGTVFRNFSYAGVDFNPTTRAWSVYPYACSATFTQPLEDDALHLDRLLTVWLSEQPGSDVILIGHSQGGVIALAYLAYLRQLAGERAWRLPFNARLANVITLDAPLGGLGYPADTDSLIAALLQSFNCPEMTDRPTADFISLAQMTRFQQGRGGYPLGATGNIAGVLYPESTPDGFNNQLLLRQAVTRLNGMQMLTIGNTRDFVFGDNFPHGTPCEIVRGFQSTQWLIEEPPSGVWSRTALLGWPQCVVALATNRANHQEVLEAPPDETVIIAPPNSVDRQEVQTSIVNFIGGQPLTLSPLLPDLMVNVSVNPIGINVLSDNRVVKMWAGNGGAAPAEGVRVTLTLPAGARYQTSRASAGFVCRHTGDGDLGGEVICDGGTLPPSSSALIETWIAKPSPALMPATFDAHIELLVGEELDSANNWTRAFG